MKMFLELHLLQNFALSNLNRDDTGAPKSCIFGGSRRARISSQCLKRAVRTVVRTENLVPSENLSYRTKKLVELLTAELQTAGIDVEQAKLAAIQAMAALDLKLKNDKTEYLLMVGQKEVAGLGIICMKYLPQLLEAAASAAEGKSKGKKIDDAIGKEMLAALDGGDAIDMALFGRMVATHPEKSIDAAVQMAHAFSTNIAAHEFDFYSAVDDLQNREEESGAGAAMIGTMLYNSSCYYRYANLDIGQLGKNLNGQQDLVVNAIKGFLEGMIKAVPTGKQTNSGAQNPPSLIMVVLREGNLWSLANAFTTPVFGGKEDIMSSSAKLLFNHWNQLHKLFGPEGISFAGLATFVNLDEQPQGVTPYDNFNDLKVKVINEIALPRN